MAIRCTIRARKLIFQTTANNPKIMMMNLNNSCMNRSIVTQSFITGSQRLSNCGLIGQFGVKRRNLWCGSRDSTKFFRNLNAFVSDFSASNPSQKPVSFFFLIFRNLWCG